MRIEALDLITAPLSGSTLVEAGAGTGKTYALTGLYLRLLLEERLTVDQILVVTFTEAATEELRDRIRWRLTEAVQVLEGQETQDDFLRRTAEIYRDTDARALLQGALRNFDLARIFTIHGFCRHTLTRSGFESGLLFDTALEPDLSALTRQVCVDFWRQRILPLEGLSGTFVRGQMPVTRLENLANLPFLAQEPRLEPQDAAPDTKAAERAFTELTAQLQRTWAAAQEDVRDLLFGHTDLNQKMGKPDLLQKRLQTLDAYLAAPSLELPENTKKFLNGLTPAYMRKMTRKGAEPPDHPLFHLVAEVQAGAARLKAELNMLCVCLCRDFLAGLDADLQARKNKHNVQGFDDLIRAVRRAVDDEVFVRKNPYRAALIDEFQDTDGLQYAIFSTLFQDLPLFFIGDPKQAIYSFRGADLNTYLRAARHSTRKAALDTNYRSTPELIQAINKIFERENPFLNPEITYTSVAWPDELRAHPLREDGQETPALTIWMPRDEKHLGRTKITPLICRAMAAEISRLLHAADQDRVFLGDEPLRAGDIAVLVETNRQGALVHQALLACGIHSVLHQEASVFETPEAREILSLLSALLRRRDRTALRTALSTTIVGLTAADLRELDTDAEMLEKWEDRMAAWHGAWQTQGVMAAMSRLLRETEARPRLLGLMDGERRMTNVLHCLEILHARERSTHCSMPALTRWFAKQLDTPSTEESQLRLDSDRDAVRIATIHKSKGLEYPVVFCPFLFRATNTDEKHALTDEDGLVLDLGSADFERRRKEQEQDARAELIRLTYVALTRAKSRCYMVWGRFNKAESCALTWIFHGHRAEAENIVDWKNISEEEVLADLHALASPGIIEVTDLPETEPQILTRRAGAEEILTCRPWTRRLTSVFGLSSFSGLTRGLAHALPPGLDDADDMGDAVDQSGPEDVMDVPEDQDRIAQFPRGATAGSCLHRVFELVDFHRPESVPPAVDQALAQFGMDPVWKPVVEDLVRRTLKTDLGGFQLSGMKERLVELEFLFPLRPVTRDALRQVYQDHAPDLPPDLDLHMDRLRFEPRQGFMTGFIDLVVRHEGRFYLIDWKSNRLGAAAALYTPQALYQAMTEHHYFLQYHLYCLALDRYLSTRLPEYTYAEHFGGVRYVFLRGMDPERPGQGVYADCPDPDFLAALGDALFADGPET